MKENNLEEIVQMEEKHVEALYDLEQRCFAIPWTKEALYMETRQNASCYAVALVEGQVVGYGGFRQVLDEGNINNIAVLPEFRERQIGKKIVSRLLEIGKQNGVKDFFLEVRVSNVAAQKLYCGAGFVEVGRRKGYYRDNGEDALLMKKSIE